MNRENNYYLETTVKIKWEKENDIKMETMDIKQTHDMEQENNGINQTTINFNSNDGNNESHHKAQKENKK